ncbi:probable protein phosphatase 2C 43 [Lathyrus oleraceus]|uniref:PPM-type phosphatase domain-containing protein n=1 Tax=Pisum sativum TaxID=3888 RepID=A0A9D5B1R2_PEA|nr:probable protein phosphatase 2C 43 [Pisum sativum]KAI5426875.1 hypothetical protein KIW84_032345 [Pisum sativum]
MFLCVQNVLCACSSKNTLDMVDDIDIDEFRADPLGWTMKVIKHPFGEFSMAAVQANEDMEDFSQVEIDKEALFVGIYDGENGVIASEFLSQSLLPALLFLIKQNGENMSEDILRDVVDRMEKRFMLDADELHYHQPERVQASSSCLCCIIWKGRLYIANLGDSRAVMGSLGPFDILRVQQLVRDHNAGNRHIKVELARLHPDDPNIVMYHRDAWRVRGISKVSRCIGNAYLKRERFTLDPSFEVPRTELAPSDFTRTLLSAEPEIHSRVLRDSNKFIIFGSGGLWKLLTNEEAAKIVNTNPREGIAKRLVRIALEVAAREKNITYNELLKLPKGHDFTKGPSVSFERTRRSYHDDISVTVVFLDKTPDIDMSVMRDVIPSVPTINSFRSFHDTALRSCFHRMYAPEPVIIRSTVDF